MDWIFPKLGGGQRNGLNDAGIAFFSDDAVRAMTRETLQNSIDAHLDGAPPVKVTFSLVRISTADFPGYPSLKMTLEKSRDYMFEYVKKDENRFRENGKRQFEDALSTLILETIPVLRVRDENTTGLEGGDDDGSSWDRLIRTQGAPTEHGAGGGSFGIGQRAPFAASALRSVFYGTVRPEGFCFIGKSVWCSWKDEDGAWRQNTGFLGTLDGDEFVRGIKDPELVSTHFRRVDRGTDIFIAGFPGKSGWADVIVDSVCSDFFAAIGQGLLHVVIDDEGKVLHDLSKSTIQSVVDARFAQALAAAATKVARDEVEKGLGNARFFLKAIVADKPICREHDKLGQMRLYVERDPQARQRVAFMRSPRILVYSRSVPVLPGYAAVFMCDSDAGNRMLRAYEGPEHSSWTRKVPGRDRVMSDVQKFVRDELEKLAGTDGMETRDIDDLSKYLPDELPAVPIDVKLSKGAKGVKTAEETAARKAKVGKVRVGTSPKPEPPKTVEPGDAASDPGTDESGSGGAGGGPDDPTDEGGGGGGGGGEKPGPDAGKGSEKGKPARGLRPEELRFRSWFDAKTTETFLVVIPTRSGKARLRIRAVDEDNKPRKMSITQVVLDSTNEKVPITAGDTVGPLNLTKAQRHVYRIQLASKYPLALTAEVVQ